MKMACGDPSAAFRAAILDPDLTISAPRPVTAMAGFDAVAHAVETWVTKRRTPLSDLFAERAWTLLNGAYERVLSASDDRAARADMTLGAHFAGMAIEQSMLGAAHACANPLTARFNVTHGLALAMLLPHVVRWNAPVVGDRYAELLPTSRRGARACRSAGGAPGGTDVRRGAAVDAKGRRRDGRLDPRACRAGGPTVDRHLQPPSLRRLGRQGNLPSGVLTGGQATQRT